MIGGEAEALRDGGHGLEVGALGEGRRREEQLGRGRGHRILQAERRQARLLLLRTLLGYRRRCRCRRRLRHRRCSLRLLRDEQLRLLLLLLLLLLGVNLLLFCKFSLLPLLL